MFRRYWYFRKDGVGGDRKHNLQKSADYSNGYKITRAIFKDLQPKFNQKLILYLIYITLL